MVDRLYIKCSKLTADNFNTLIMNKNNINNIFMYIEIIENNDTDIPFIISTKENICSFCNNEIKEIIFFL